MKKVLNESCSACRVKSFYTKYDGCLLNGITIFSRKIHKIIKSKMQENFKKLKFDISRCRIINYGEKKCKVSKQGNEG